MTVMTFLQIMSPNTYKDNAFVYPSNKQLPHTQSLFSLHLEMVRQFLETVWPIFVLARLFGMFPCKRIRNEDGSTQLKPINGKVQLTLYSVFWVSYTVTYSFLAFSMYNKTENTMEEIALRIEETNGNNSIVDMLSTMISGLFVIIGSFAMNIG